MATVSLNVLVDKTKNHVLFVESGKDFVDILLSFLTLPMGTIVRLCGNQSPTTIRGIENLYKSVESLKENDFCTKECKAMLLCPRRASEYHCRNLKLKFDHLELEYYICEELYCHYGSLSFYPNLKCKCNRLMNKKVNLEKLESDSDGSGVFVKGGESVKYMITDDLQLFFGSFNNNCIALLHTFGITDFNQVQVTTINIGLQEVLSLLNRSLISKTPLSDVILTKRESLKDVKRELGEVSSQPISKSKTSEKERKIDVKLIIRKSTKEIMYAEARNDFIDLLFHFLTIPLGSLVRISCKNSSMACIDNLYTSVEKLSAENCIYSEECKSMLLRPMLAHHFDCDNQLLDLDKWNKDRLKSYSNYASRYYLPPQERGLKVINPKTMSEEGGGGFVKGPATFMVGDGLEVTPFSHISKILLLSKFKVSMDDVEERFVSVGAKEALNILKASCVSKNVLSSVFNV